MWLLWWSRRTFLFQDDGVYGGGIPVWDRRAAAELRLLRDCGEIHVGQTDVDVQKRAAREGNVDPDAINVLTASVRERCGKARESPAQSLSPALPIVFLASQVWMWHKAGVCHCLLNCIKCCLCDTAGSFGPGQTGPDVCVHPKLVVLG